jgi:hypothetical protein
MGSFILRSKLTENIADGALVTYFIGTVNEVGTFALDYEYKPEDEEDGGFYQITHPGNWKEGLDLFVYVTSVGMGIAFVAGLIKTVLWLKKRRMPKETDELIKNKFDEAMDLFKTRTDHMLARLANGTKFPKPEQLQTAQLAARNTQLRDKMLSSKDRLSRIIERQQALVETLATYGNSTRLSSVAGELMKLRNIEGLDIDEYLEEMGPAVESLKLNQEKLTSRTVELGGQIRANERRTIDESLELNARTIDEFHGDIKQMDEIKEDFEFEWVEK